MKKPIPTVITSICLLGGIMCGSAIAAEDEISLTVELLIAPAPISAPLIAPAPLIYSAPTAARYEDVEASAWYYHDISYVLENNLLSPVAMHSFAPNTAATKIELITALWKMAGEPVVNYLMQFNDVDEDETPFAEAIRWAASEQISAADENGNFAPDSELSREQAASIIYSYARSKDMGFKGMWMFRLDYEDTDQISEDGFEPVAWCVMNKIMGGTADRILSPQSIASRAELSAFITRADKYFTE